MSDTKHGRTPTEQDIRTWLIEHVAEAAGIPPDEVDVRDPLESYGLSSREAVSMVGDLEDWLGRRLSPTLVWEYPAIEALARYLNGAHPQPPGPTAPAPPAPTARQPALTAAEVAELSDEEAEALLLKKLTDLGQ